MEAEKLKIFSCPSRIKLLLCLGQKKKTVTELLQECHLSQPATSQHLALLKRMKVVAAKREGRKVYYQLKDKRVFKIAQELARFINLK